MILVSAAVPSFTNNATKQVINEILGRAEIAGHALQFPLHVAYSLRILNEALKEFLYRLSDDLQATRK